MKKPNTRVAMYLRGKGYRGRKEVGFDTNKINSIFWLSTDGLRIHHVSGGQIGHYFRRFLRRLEMAKVECEVEYVTLENDKGNDVDGVRATCGKCGHETESFGQGDKSVKRCLVLLHEECPEGEDNFYVDGDEL